MSAVRYDYDKAELAAAIQSGQKSIPEIAKIFGITSGAVYTFAKRNNLQFLRERKPRAGKQASFVSKHAIETMKPLLPGYKIDGTPDNAYSVPFDDVADDLIERIPDHISVNVEPVAAPEPVKPRLMKKLEVFEGEAINMNMRPDNVTVEVFASLDFAPYGEALDRIKAAIAELQEAAELIERRMAE